MKKLKLAPILFAFLPLLPGTSILSAECPCKHKELNGRIPPTNQRYATFQLALDLMEQRQVKVIVETGTARNGAQNCIGDGCSTLIFADWAHRHHAYIYSVDINPTAIATAKKVTRFHANNIECVCSDSVAFLDNFNQPIDFLYLDSYDYELDNPRPSQEHHLKEIMAAYPHLTQESIVMIDDCDLPGGGKGLLVIQYLLDRGWKVVLAGYQTILIKN